MLASVINTMCVKYFILYNSTSQELSNCLYKGPGNKFFRLCKPYNPSQQFDLFCSSNAAITCINN